MVTGHIKTGAITQDLAAGGELFLRSVQQPGSTPRESAIARRHVQDGAVYTYVGSENIYQPIAPRCPSRARFESAGPAQALGRQSPIGGDRAGPDSSSRPHSIARRRTIRFAARPQLLRCSRTIHSPGACAPNVHRQAVWLPQYAVTFNPVDNLTLYGNYGVMLSLGPQGPWWVDNASQFLAPFFTRQAEIGAKYEPGQRILLTTAFFHMRAPFFYPKVIAGSRQLLPRKRVHGPGDLCFESEGRETHDGIELNAEGKAANWLRLTASAAAIRAISDDTGTPSFDNKQVINVPHLRTTVFADIALPHMHGLHLMPGWGYTGRKEATRDDVVSVPGYNLFNLGARYTPGGEQGRVTFGSMPTTSPTSATGTIPARVTATHSSSWARQRQCGSRRITLFKICWHRGSKR